MMGFKTKKPKVEISTATYVKLDEVTSDWRISTLREAIDDLILTLADHVDGGVHTLDAMFHGDIDEYITRGVDDVLDDIDHVLAKRKRLE